MSLLSSEQARLVEAAIGRAEAQSAGELVVAVLPRSDTYAGPRALVSCAWALALGLVVSWGAPGWPPALVLVCQLPLGVALWMAWSWPPLTRLLVRPRHMAPRVHARAMQLFAERGVHHTRDRSGLLILVSELEHHVVILGDAGIHAHIGTQGWQLHVRTLVAGLKRRALGPALVQVVDAFGAVLAAKFPRRPDDTNELPDDIVRH